MREFDLSIIPSMLSNTTDEIYLWLIEITHEDLLDAIRLVINTEDVMSNGQQYTKITCKIDLPDSKESGLAYGNITFSNINRALIPAFRSLPSKIYLTLKLATASNLSASPPEFNNVHIELLPFLLDSITWNETTVRGSISYESTLGRKYPCVKMDIFNAPGLFE